MLQGTTGLPFTRPRFAGDLTAQALCDPKPQFWQARIGARSLD